MQVLGEVDTNIFISLFLWIIIRTYKYIIRIFTLSIMNIFYSKK